AVLEKNSRRESKALACLSLAEMTRDKPGGQSDKYFQQLADQFADVRYNRSTMGEYARQQLNEKKALAGQGGTPAEQFQASVKEFERAQAEFNRAYQLAATDKERSQVVEKLYPQPQKFAEKFMHIAAQFPDDPVAVDALSWVVTQVRFGPVATRALAIISERYAKSDKLAPLAESLAMSGDQGAEKLLRAMMDQNPNPEVQGQACFSLASLLS